MRKQILKNIKRIVVKIGSSVFVDSKGNLDKTCLKSIVGQIAMLIDQGIQVILVSSGAIACGMSELKIECRPGKLSCLQSMAAVGQGILMRIYNDLFKNENKTPAQVLLTWDDFDNRARYINAKNTVFSLLKYGSIPIINENDTVSTEEIKFGDNDRLSSLVVSLVEADLLIILSDVDGFYKIKDGHKDIISEVADINKETEAFASGTNKRHISKGGMITKLEAAKISTNSGIPCVVANGRTSNIILKIIKGENVGTLFIGKPKIVVAKKQWLAFGTKPKARLIVDEGAREALINKGKSLLYPGIIGVVGNFSQGEVVAICDKTQTEFAKGIVNFSKEELQKIRLSRIQAKEVIHRDNLVITKK